MSFRTNNVAVQGVVDSRISGKVGSEIQAFDAKLSGIAGLTLGGNGAKALVVNATGTSIELSAQALGSAAYLNTGTGAGQIPVLDGSGKIAQSALPAIKVGDVSVVADLTARDAITGMVEGDVAIVSAESKTYIFDGSAWQEMLSPAGGAALVTSVAGKTGAVTLSLNDMTDVVIGGVSLAAGQTIRWNGTEFVNDVLSYNDLADKPVMFSGSYDDLSNKPTLFSGNYADLVGKPTLAPVATSGSYNDLADKPVLFSGSYNDLTDKPVAFSGSYDDLTNKPVLGTMAAEATTSYYTKTEADAAFAPVVHSHVIGDITGLQAALDSKLEAGDIVVPTKTSDLTNDSGFITLSDVPAQTPEDNSMAKGVSIVTAAGSVTVAAGDHIVIINKTAGEATSVSLPAGVTGKMVVIKDGKGDANTNNITISGSANVDGQASVVIAQSYESVTLVFNGNEWNVI